MNVFLIHGMGRSPASLILLRARLLKAGHRPHLFGYSVAFESLDRIAKRFADRVATTPDSSPRRYAIIGHSLENVIARLAADMLPEGLVCLVMFAPPNRSPLLARKLRNHWMFKTLTRDAGSRLSDPEFFERLQVPRVRTLVLAGNCGPRHHWMPFGRSANDGIVAVAETLLDGAEHREVPAIHTFIMNHRGATDDALRFLSAE